MYHTIMCSFETVKAENGLESTAQQNETAAHHLKLTVAQKAQDAAA